MRVLVAVATRHGATYELAGEIARALALRGLEVVTQRVEDADLRGADAVVLGSAVYMGRWLAPARHFAEAHASELSELPTWLFSSGPLGNPPSPGDLDLHELAQLVGAREHRVFSGKLDRDALGVGERVVARVVHAPYGDFRDREQVRAWADQIATALGAPVTSASRANLA
jgi:menaquinone-dependent protoporphyrinogen oxidase